MQIGIPLILLSFAVYALYRTFRSGKEEVTTIDLATSYKAFETMLDFKRQEDLLILSIKSPSYVGSIEIMPKLRIDLLAAIQTGDNIQTVESQTFKIVLERTEDGTLEVALSQMPHDYEELRFTLDDDGIDWLLGWLQPI